MPRSWLYVSLLMVVAAGIYLVHSAPQKDETSAASSKIVRFEMIPAKKPFLTRHVSAPDDQHAWAGLVHTSNGGRTWLLAIPKPGQDFVLSSPKEDLVYESTYFSTARLGWLNDYDNDAVWHTDDGGATWTPVWESLEAIGFFQHRVGVVAVSDRGSIRHLTTVDSGATWNACVESGVKQQWRLADDVLFITPSVAYSALKRDRDESAVGKTVDGGCHWTVVWTPPYKSLDVFFLDSEHGWVAAYGGYILRTADGGQTWTTRDCPAGSKDCGDPYFVSPTDGWIRVGPPDPLTRDTGLYRTTDGEHWSPVSRADILDKGRNQLASGWEYGRFVRMVLGPQN